MIEPFEAAWEIGEFLSKESIPYIVIGGLAVQIWGDARLTIDVDMTIMSSIETGIEPLLKIITKHYPSRVSDPLTFARQTRMILITASNHVDVDISLALPGYEDSLLERAIQFKFETNKTISLCSAEDLIIHKAIAGRPQDVSDIQGIVFRQGNNLDLEYIQSWLTQFAGLLENQDAINRFDQAWEKFLDLDS